MFNPASTKVIKIGDVFENIVGNAELDMNPLACFYCAVLGDIYLNVMVEMNPTCVKVNHMDARILYRNLRKYSEENYPDLDAGFITSQLWLKVGPTVSKSVPRGHVYLDAGYLYLEGTKT